MRVYLIQFRIYRDIEMEKNWSTNDEMLSIVAFKVHYFQFTSFCSHI